MKTYKIKSIDLIELIAGSFHSKIKIETQKGFAPKVQLSGDNYLQALGWVYKSLSKNESVKVFGSTEHAGATYYLNSEITVLFTSEQEEVIKNWAETIN